MKIQYNFTLCNKVTMLCTLLFCMLGTAYKANAQLNGTSYTIDTTAANSSTNFKSFKRFVGALRSQGVSGNVTVTVKNGPYTEQVDIPQISSMSSARRVTIEGNNQTLEFSASVSNARYTMRFDGADFFTVKNLTVKALGSTLAIGVQFKNDSRNNTLSGCTIECPNVQSSTGYWWNLYNNVSAIVLLTNSNTQGSPDYYYGSNWVTDQGGQTASNITIENCNLKGASSSSVSGPMFGIFECGENDYYSYNSSYITNNTFKYNKISNCYFNYIGSLYCDGTHIIGNELFRDVYWSNNTYAYIWPMSVIFMNASDREVRVEGNIIRQIQGPNTSSLSVSNYPYSLWSLYVEDDGYTSTSYQRHFTKNKIYNSEAGGYNYGFYKNYGLSGDMVTNNLVSNLKANYQSMGMVNQYQSGGLTAHNTIYFSDPEAGSKPYFGDNFGLYVYHWQTCSEEMRGNLAYLDYSGSSSAHYAFYVDGTSNYPAPISNHAYDGENPTDPFVMDGTYTTAADVNNMSSPASNNTAGKIKFSNPGNYEFKINTFKFNNTVDWDETVEDDINGTIRNTAKTDIGAFETFIDMRTDSLRWTGSTTVCAGTKIKPVVRVTNLFTDTASDFKVSVKYGNQPEVSEMVSAKIAPNQSYVHTFATEYTLSNVGLHTLRAGVNIPDDNTVNDSQKRTIRVNPAPSGGSYAFSTKPTRAVYRLGKPFDVTVVGTPVIYNINPPRAFSNAQYGTAWDVTSTWATKVSDGTSLPAGDIVFTPASGTTLGEIKFTPSVTTDECYYVWVNSRIRDITNGCDTVIRRQVYIHGRVKPNFTYNNSICDKTSALFNNLSTVACGAIEYTWDFGTGVAADTTNATSPVFDFPGPGTYTVTMKARTLPWGFEEVLTGTITVNPVPVVKFSKTNACEGKSLTFTNQTSPVNSTYVWNFGDNTSANTTNATKMYTSAGQYLVTLTAELAGCKSSTSQKVYQFSKPAANFALNTGSCQNEPFSFSNSSTISNGNFGSYWNMDDNGNISTADEPAYNFTTAGIHNVKLIVTSEFGCKDSIVKIITVRPAPQVAFTNTSTCSVTPTQFNNTTPTVTGTNAAYTWNFGDGGNSTIENPIHSWIGLGNKTVTFKVTLDNGCSNIISKTITVGVQPTADFAAANTCDGKPVVFENNTTWPQGNISYLWDFASMAPNSTASDPVVTPSVSGGATRSYNVTLVATIAGGCSDTKVKSITILESPSTCDFEAYPDYANGFYGMKFLPKKANGQLGEDPGVTYTWKYDNEGNSNVAFHNWQFDGTYTVTMRAKGSNGCDCEKTKTVVMNRAGLNGKAVQTARIFPNPNNGNFTIALSQDYFGKSSVEIVSVAGQVVKTFSAQGSKFAISAADLAAGIYTVRVNNDNGLFVGKINVQ